MRDLTRRGFIAAGAASLGLGALPAFGNTYPSKPVTFIVPFPPGGPVDVTARGMANELARLWNHSIVVDNRGGAGGIVGAQIAAKAPPDGHSVFICSIHHSVLPSLKNNLGYDVEKDFVPVSFGAMFPVILVAHPSLPAKTVPELVAYAKANPGKLSFSSAGTGGGTHLAGELFKSFTGTDLLHVPYRGSAPAMTDLLGGQVQLMFSDAPTALPQIAAGKVRALGVASPERSSLVPDLPTIAEAGVPGYEAYSWAGVLVPAATPKDVIAKLNAGIVQALGNPEVKERLLKAGAEARATSPEEFGRFFKAEMTKWAKVVKDAKIEVE
jgi:tripartite-type tricarboxylate transporter receptor subunit TctC